MRDKLIEVVKDKIETEEKILKLVDKLQKKYPNYHFYIQSMTKDNKIVKINVGCVI